LRIKDLEILLNGLKNKNNMEIKGTELEFINDFYKRIGEFKTIDGTLGYIFDTIEDLLLAKENKLVDEMLKRMIVENFTIIVLIGVLTITFPFRKVLPSRKDFYQRIEDYWMIIDGDMRALRGLNDD